MNRLILYTATALLGVSGYSALAAAQSTAPDTNTAPTAVPSPAPADPTAAAPMAPAPAATSTSGPLAPPPADAFNKTYPLCTAQLRDSCINPSQAPASMRGRHRGRTPAN